ncbi:MAG: choline-sulfatase [Acidobacteria bacterium]|nr:choline-sulfatase [Acidobacteriota bacterium]
MLSESLQWSRRSLLTGLGISFAQQKRPNVLILYADDQRADTIREHGNSLIDTPNLDRLSRSGVSFRSCYNQGGHVGAVCIASRAMLMSGKSLWRATGQGGLDGTLMPERFREAGYESFFTGKWHNGEPTLLRSFEQGGLVHMGGMGPQISPELSQFGSKTKESQEGRATPLFSNGLIHFLKRRTKSSKPFFGYCAFTAPHDPRQASPEYFKRYESRELALPRPWFPTPPLDNGELKIRDEMVVPAPRTREQCLSELKSYYALITELDAYVGKILQTLDDTGERQNTIVVYAADNGLAMGAHGLMGKQSMYEHSLRVPLIMAGPGISARVERKPMYLYEVYGRLCQATGLSAPSAVENPGAPLYFGYRNFQRAVRIGDRKMSWSGSTKEQYNLAKDPHEEHNLIGTLPEAEFDAARLKAKAYFADPN